MKASPTDWQQRNRRWIGEHPVGLAIGIGLIFASVGGSLAAFGGASSWTVPAALGGGLLGAVLGALVSADYGGRTSTQDGRNRRWYVVLVGILIVVLVGLRIVLAFN